MSAEAFRAAEGGTRDASRARLRLLAALLAAATCLVFAPVLRNDFLQIDDDYYITGNPLVTAGITQPGILWALTSTDRDNWQPLTWIGHMLAVEISGKSAWGHHLLSVLLHALTAALLFVFLDRATGRRATSLFVAALFALHPLRLESVAWAAELKDPLSGVFFMAALTCYAGFVRRRRARDYLALALVFALALTAKPTVVTLPLALLLLDYWPLGRWSRGATGLLLLEKIPLLLLSAIDSVLTIEAQSRVGALRTLDAIPLGLRVQNALVSTAAYLGKFFWPARLSAYYPLSADALSVTAAAAAGALLLAVTVLALRLREGAPAVPVGWLWYLATLAPMSGIVQVGLQSMADRYTYLPQIGLGIALAWGGAGLVRRLGPARSPRLSRALVWAAACTVLLLAALTTLRTEVWRTTVRLFSDALVHDPGNWFAHLKLAEVHLSKGRVPEGLPHAERAVAARPDFPNTRLVYGLLLGKSGREREAEEQFRQALRLNPGWAEALHHLGLALFKQKRFEEALVPLQRELRDAPASARALMGVALVEEALGRLDDAERHCRTWLHVEPKSALARMLLGRLAEARGDTARAIAAYGAALALNPGFNEARAGLERLGAATPQENQGQ